MSSLKVNVVNRCMCVQHDTTRKFFMTVEAPHTIRRGEQIGLRLCIFSTWDQDMEVLCFLLTTASLFFTGTHTPHLSTFFRVNLAGSKCVNLNCQT